MLDRMGARIRMAATYVFTAAAATIGINRVGSVFPEEDCDVGSSGIQSE
jgi:hypothetical protein